MSVDLGGTVEPQLPASQVLQPLAPASMCLFAPLVACKPTPASLPSPTLTKPDSTIVLFFKCLLISCYPFWTTALTFLLVPQACSSPYLTSCHLDPASSLYSKATLDENPCYERCLTSSFCVILVLLNILNVYIYVIEQRVVRREKPDKKNETAQSA